MKDDIDKDISETITQLGKMPMSREARDRAMVLLRDVMSAPDAAGMDAPLSALFTVIQEGLETQLMEARAAIFDASDEDSLVVRRLFALLEPLIRHFDVLAGESRDTQWFRQRLLDSKTTVQFEAVFDELEARLLESDSRLTLDREREEKALGYLQLQLEEMSQSAKVLRDSVTADDVESTQGELTRIAERLMVIERKVNELRSGLRNRSDLNLKDGWTGLYRDEGFGVRAGELFSRWERAASPLSVVIVSVNAGGDHVLTPLSRNELMSQTASELAGRVRISDLLGFTGEDRFTLLLPDTNLEGCHAFASRMVLGLETAGFNQLGKQIRVAVAAGITSAMEGDSLNTLLGRAAKARDEAEAKGAVCEALV